MQRRPSSHSDAPHPLPRSALPPSGLFSASCPRLVRVHRSESVDRSSAVQVLSSPILCAPTTALQIRVLRVPFSPLFFLVQRDVAWPAYLTSGRIGGVISTRTSSAHGPSHAPSSRWRRPDHPRRPSQPRVQSLIRVSYTSFRATRPPLSQGTPSASLGFPVSIHNPTYPLLLLRTRPPSLPYPVRTSPAYPHMRLPAIRAHTTCAQPTQFSVAPLHVLRTRSEHLNSAPPLATPWLLYTARAGFHGSQPTSICYSHDRNSLAVRHEPPLTRLVADTEPEHATHSARRLAQTVDRPGSPIAGSLPGDPAHGKHHSGGSHCTHHSVAFGVLHVRTARHGGPL
ncbi:hypothetical protein C8Q73DRAFT_25293 [Cubamyces lactineus]|nr:hypothetical protein C8Q73DRAFT_25293 [Cubamyces lactineus]